MIPTEQIKHTILYIISLDVILALGATWIATFNTVLSDIGATALTVCAVIISIYTIIHLREKVKGQRLDNLLKEKELKK